jgi:hypothetical protein
LINKNKINPQTRIQRRQRVFDEGSLAVIHGHSFNRLRAELATANVDRTCRPMQIDRERVVRFRQGEAEGLKHRADQLGVGNDLGWLGLS